MKSAIKITVFALFAAAFGASLAGCSKEDSYQLSGGKQPLTLTATVEGQSAPQAAQAATHATTDNTWTAGEEVAILINNEVKKHTVAADGKLTVAQGVTTFYWTNIIMKAEAWYSAAYYSTTKPTSFSVNTDQSDDGYRQSDMIYASQDITFNKSTPASLQFKHLPAKVVVNLKHGEGVTEDEVTAATVTLVGQNLTSGAIAADWTVTTATIGSNGITPNALSSATAGCQKTVQALVVPQQMQNRQFIKITISTAARDYYYIPTAENDANLQAGNQYTYTITVKKTGLAVMVKVKDNGVVWDENITSGDASTADFRIAVPSDCTVSSTDGTMEQKTNYWVLSGSNEFQLKIPKQDGKILKDVSVTGLYTLLSWTKDGSGDYVITYKIRSDVTLTSDGFADKTTPAVGDYYYGDGEWCTELLPNKPCIGIVFKVGSDGTNDAVYKYERKLSQIRGYAVALRDAPGDRQPFSYWNDIDKFTTSTTDFSGYTQTQIMSKSTFFSLAKNWACYSAVNYSPAAPTGTSGWYLPSLGEWNVLWQAFGTVRGKLTTAGGTDMSKDSGFYWSMSKKESGDTSPALVHFGEWSSYANFTKNIKNDNSSSYSRPVLTF